MTTLPGVTYRVRDMEDCAECQNARVVRVRTSDEEASETGVMWRMVRCMGCDRWGVKLSDTVRVCICCGPGGSHNPPDHDERCQCICLEGTSGA